MQCHYLNVELHPTFSERTSESRARPCFNQSRASVVIYEAGDGAVGRSVAGG